VYNHHVNGAEQGLPHYTTHSILFCYGLLNLIRYILLTMKKGFYFNRQTEKGELELQTGSYIKIC
jgi:hypothetical protein